MVDVARAVPVAQVEGFQEGVPTASAVDYVDLVDEQLDKQQAAVVGQLVKVVKLEQAAAHAVQLMRQCN